MTTADTTYFSAHPRSTLALLSQTLQIFSRHFTHFAGLSLPVMGPLALLGLLGGAFSSQTTLSLQENITGISSNAQAFSQVTGTIISSCTSLLVLITGAFFPWMEGALTYSLFERVLGRAPSTRDAYTATQSRFASLWGSNALARLALFAPLVLLSCVGIFVTAIMVAAATDGSTGDADMGLAFGIGAVCLVPLLAAYLIYLFVMGVNWRFRAPAIVAEGVDATRSLGRSMELAKGQRVRLLGCMLVFWLIEAVFVGGPLFASVLLSLASYQIPEGGGLAYAISILFLVIGGVTQLVITPLHIIYVALLYLDVRVRKENLNLQPAHTPTPKVIEPVLIPATTTPSAAMPVSVAPIIVTPSSTPSVPTQPAAAMPTLPLGSIATPAQKIGSLFNRMRTEGPSADLLNDLGMAYMDVGDLGGALDAFTRARDLAPSDADIAYNLVLLHRARKDTPSARSMMQEYLRLETNPADIERVRADARFSDLL
jgi:CRISPR-associated Cas5-like protein